MSMVKVIYTVSKRKLLQVHRSLKCALLGGILPRCQYEVTATTQLSCWVPLQTFCFSMCVCIYVCVSTLTSGAFICTPMVKHGGEALATQCSHTHAHKHMHPHSWAWRCIFSSLASILMCYGVLGE